MGVGISQIVESVESVGLRRSLADASVLWVFLHICMALPQTKRFDAKPCSQCNYATIETVGMMVWGNETD